jgi:hypothetical protein
LPDAGDGEELNIPEQRRFRTEISGVCVPRRLLVLFKILNNSRFYHQCISKNMRLLETLRLSLGNCQCLLGQKGLKYLGSRYVEISSGVESSIGVNLAVNFQTDGKVGFISASFCTRNN